MTEVGATLPHGFTSWWRRALLAAVSSLPLYIVCAWLIERWTSSDAGLVLVIAFITTIVAPWIIEARRASGSDGQSGLTRALLYLAWLLVAAGLCMMCASGEVTVQLGGAVGLCVLAVVVSQRSRLQRWMDY